MVNFHNLHKERPEIKESHTYAAQIIMQENKNGKKIDHKVILGVVVQYSEEEQRKDAYRLKNKEIGYKPELQVEDSY